MTASVHQAMQGRCPDHLGQLGIGGAHRALDRPAQIARGHDDLRDRRQCRSSLEDAPAGQYAIGDFEVVEPGHSNDCWRNSARYSHSHFLPPADLGIAAAVRVREQSTTNCDEAETEFCRQLVVRGKVATSRSFCSECGTSILAVVA